jgi:hypothetical protein
MTIRTTEFLLKLGTVEQIKASAGKCGGVKFNTHIHLPPNFSAFETVGQAVELAAKENIKILGVGNYYDFGVYQTFTEAVLKRGIFPLFGTEIIALETDLQKQGVRINDPGNPGKYYICGKGISRFETFSSRAAELMNGIRKNDTLRMREMVAKLAEAFGKGGVKTGLDDQAVIARVVKRHGCKAEMVTLQERHLAQAFQEVFFEKVPADQRAEKLAAIFGCPAKSGANDAVGVQDEIRSHLMKAGKSCFAPETFVNLAQAKELIVELGGIPCYPVLADGSKQRCEYEATADKLVETLKANSYRMVEFIPARNQPEVLAEYVTTIRKAGIAVVAGTEHNTLAPLPIEPACVGGKAIPDAVKAIFWEGVCVLAAHVFLKAHGQKGFMDCGCCDAEKRIETFRAIGEAVLAAFFKSKIKN